MSTTISNKIYGYRELAKITSKVIAKIETHFKRFQGEKILLTNGGFNKKFRDEIKRFQSEFSYYNFHNLHIYNQSDMTVYIKISIWVKHGQDSQGVSQGAYYNHEFRVADLSGAWNDHVTDKVFDYKFDCDTIKKWMGEFMKVTPQKMSKAMKDYKALEEKQKAVIDRLPYYFSDEIKRGY